MSSDTVPQIEAEVQRRIAAVSSTSVDEWRLRMMESVTRIEVKQDYVQLALDEHRKDDKEQLAGIHAKIGGVTSIIYEDNKQGTISLKQAIIGTLVTLSVLGGWAVSIWLALRGGKP